MNKYIVLDTNCLLQSLSKRSTYYKVWEDFVMGKYILCVSNEINVLKTIPFPKVEIKRLKEFYEELCLLG